MTGHAFAIAGLKKKYKKWNYSNRRADFFIRFLFLKFISLTPKTNRAVIATLIISYYKYMIMSSNALASI